VFDEAHPPCRDLVGSRKYTKFTNKNTKKGGSRKSRPNKPNPSSELIRDLKEIIRGTVKNKAAPRVKPGSIRRKVQASSGVAMSKAHPVVRSLKGILSPFSAERGSVGGLVDARPSQKFMARGLLSVTIPTAADFMVFVSPSIGNSNNDPSLCVTWNTTGAFGDASSVFTSPTVGLTPAGLGQSFMVTSTPYPVSTLDDGTDSWRNLSCGIRARYTGPKLYQGSLIKFYHDTRGDLLQQSELGNFTFANLAERLNSHHGVVRFSFTDNPELVINLSSVTAESQEWSETPYYSPGNKEWYGARIGGTTSTRQLGQPIAYVYGTNTTGNTLHFDIEMVEHWEICGKTVDALNTPSCGSAELAGSISTLVVSAHQHLAANPHKKYHEALKSVAKDPHVRAAFNGFASSAMMSALAML